MNANNQTLGIFVRHPVAGRVKTRLAAELGEQRACAIYAAFLADLVARFRRTGTQRLLCFTPQNRDSRCYFERLAGDDFKLWPQPEGDLGARMQRFFDDHLRAADDRVVVIGSDSPTLPMDYLARAFGELARGTPTPADCVIGPAADGGYYLIGMTGRVWPVFEGVSWSTACVLGQTVARLVGSRARLALLPVWYDVDTPDDWRMLAGHVRALEACNSSIKLDATRRELRLDTANGPHRI
jgi:rSAM/selenodomain-associated transferase 1